MPSKILSSGVRLFLRVDQQHIAGPVDVQFYDAAPGIAPGDGPICQCEIEGSSEDQEVMSMVSPINVKEPVPSAKRLMVDSISISSELTV